MSSLSFVIDVETGDLVDSDDGWFDENDRADAAVYCQAEQEYNAWLGDHTSGSERDRLRSEFDDEQGAISFANDTSRFMGVLVSDGLIDSLAVATEQPEVNGRIHVRSSYRDLASGQIIDELIDPLEV